ncbi:MAG: FAD-dependent oxidoreductase, partial [Deltaproteobacteria bacterium]|nr:FAD-dependent oxidoreductase [Deltaproteobacteria bacterium]
MKPLIIRSPAAFREKQSIDARTLHRVTEINLDQRRVQGENLETGKTGWEPFDQLLLAMGAISIRPKIPGIDGQGIYELNTLQSGIKVRQAVDQEKPGKIVIIGGGYIGLEMAENFILRGLDVTVVERLPQVMNTLDPDMSAPISEGIKNKGVKLFLEESVKEFETEGGQVR